LSRALFSLFGCGVGEVELFSDTFGPLSPPPCPELSSVSINSLRLVVPSAPRTRPPTSLSEHWSPRLALSPVSSYFAGLRCIVLPASLLYGPTVLQPAFIPRHGVYYILSFPDAINSERFLRIGTFPSPTHTSPFFGSPIWFPKPPNFSGLLPAPFFQPPRVTPHAFFLLELSFFLRGSSRSAVTEGPYETRSPFQGPPFIGLKREPGFPVVFFC